MPQIQIRGALIVKMAPNVNDMTTRDMVMNLNEEDWFETLDGVNPKCIIKYLDMRNIPHREALQVNLYTAKGREGKRNFAKVLRMADDYNELLRKYYELEAKLENGDIQREDQDTPRECE